jgi:NitT/TauT family transport system ATP-binding protein
MAVGAPKKDTVKQSKVLLKHVTKAYGSSPNDFVAVENLHLEVFENEILCLVGPSGCGKTTTINLVAGFIRPTSGEVLIDGQVVGGPNSLCGVVFQADSVFPWMTVEQNVGYGLRSNGIPKGEREKLVRKYLDLVGLTGFANAWPRELSGGMRKRVDLARTYAFNPQILLLDEPFGSLDVMTKEEMQMLLLRIWQHERKTVLLVTHDPEEAIFVGHRVAVMTPRPGSIKQVFNIPFDMPRESSLRLTPQFLDLRREVVEALATSSSDTGM